MYNGAWSYMRLHFQSLKNTKKKVIKCNSPDCKYVILKLEKIVNFKHYWSEKNLKSLRNLTDLFMFWISNPTGNASSKRWKYEICTLHRVFPVTAIGQHCGHRNMYFVHTKVGTLFARQNILEVFTTTLGFMQNRFGNFKLELKVNTQTAEKFAVKE